MGKLLPAAYIPMQDLPVRFKTLKMLGKGG